MGDPLYFQGIYIRKKRNRSGIVSIQVLIEVGGENKLLRTSGYAKTKLEGDLFQLLSKTEMRKLQGTQIFFEDPVQL